ncbi:hypothetical protein QDQ39_07565 [Providencia rettgeri]|uniref:hypothetical protein n=1 Tax=Providencia TaxID=586 RepID=UPI00244D263C|nr:hypothetical protein [Providencia rettgeri]ELR5152470.1 hypothetical protein [Providencia rettgeri]MDH2395662.1 hypothetical protein [Providencia rettgeri]
MKITIECKEDEYLFALEAAKIIISNKPDGNALAIATGDNKKAFGKRSHQGNYKITVEDK